MLPGPLLAGSCHKCPDGRDHRERGTSLSKSTTLNGTKFKHASLGRRTPQSKNRSEINV